MTDAIVSSIIGTVNITSDIQSGGKGDTGEGVPVGGTQYQVLWKLDGTDYNTGWHTLAKADVGLGNADNTSDSDKPVSSAQQTALNAKANLAGGNDFSGVQRFVVAPGQSFEIVDDLDNPTIISRVSNRDPSGIAGESAVSYETLRQSGDHIFGTYGYQIVDQLNVNYGAAYVINAVANANGTADHTLGIEADGSTTEQSTADVTNFNTGSTVILGKDAASALEAVTMQQLAAWLSTELDKATLETGSIISFVTPKVYNSVAVPSVSNISDNLEGAIIGIVQKIYHQHSTAPTFPANWVKLGTGEYSTTELNIIYCEWVGALRVEYWITQ